VELTRQHNGQIPQDWLVGEINSVTGLTVVLRGAYPVSA